jgi:Choline/Carnitine o-acyltransferase
MMKSVQLFTFDGMEKASTLQANETRKRPKKRLTAVLCRADSMNRRNFTILDSSAFVLCLDAEKTHHTSSHSRRMADSLTDNYIAMAHRLLHGAGTAAFSGNRFFDKTLQVFILSAWIKQNYRGKPKKSSNHLSSASFVTFLKEKVKVSMKWWKVCVLTSLYWVIKS